MLVLGFRVFEVRRTAGSPVEVIADSFRPAPGLGGPALDHGPGALPVEAGRAELSGPTTHSAEEGTILGFCDPGGLIVLPSQSLRLCCQGISWCLPPFP